MIHLRRIYFFHNSTGIWHPICLPSRLLPAIPQKKLSYGISCVPKLSFISCVVLLLWDSVTWVRRAPHGMEVAVSHLQFMKLNLRHSGAKNHYFFLSKKFLRLMFGVTIYILWNVHFCVGSERLIKRFMHGHIAIVFRDLFLWIWRQCQCRCD